MTAALTLPENVFQDVTPTPVTQGSVPQTGQSGKHATNATTSVVGQKQRENDFLKRREDIQSYRNLSNNWDGYGGVAGADQPIQFSLNLLDEVRVTPDVPAPLVRPINEGVYMEWRFGDRLLYFEIDKESVLQYRCNVFGEETFEDPDFDVQRAKQAVVAFHENAA